MGSHRGIVMPASGLKAGTDLSAAADAATCFDDHVDGELKFGIDHIKKHLIDRSTSASV